MLGSHGKNFVWVNRRSTADMGRREQAVDFATETVKDFDGLLGVLKSHEREWIYRGQREDWPLLTTFDRAIEKYDLDRMKAFEIETHLIRDFRRRYPGGASELVKVDTLHCLSVMQHHGAPTRLLDCTYSPFVAAKFGLDYRCKDHCAAIWCFCSKWCEDAAKNVVGEAAVQKRDRDAFRNNQSFLPLYMNKRYRSKFVLGENPMYYVSERMVAQQAKFLCPGDVRARFDENLKNMAGWHLSGSVLKIKLDLDAAALKNFTHLLGRMNVNSAVLFPGLDGFAESLHEQLFRYADLATQ
jgi:hypothetical protein